jgi:SAM-dependent methyltransferase
MWYKTFFNKYYIKHLKETSNSKARDFQLSLIKKYLKRSDMALDIACGYGRHLIPLTEESYNIIGLDL